MNIAMDVDVNMGKDVDKDVHIACTRSAFILQQSVLILHKPGPILYRSAPHCRELYYNIFVNNVRTNSHNYDSNMRFRPCNQPLN